LLTYLAQQSVGINFSLYRSRITEKGWLKIYEIEGGLSALMEQRYGSADGLPNWLRDIGLITGVAGDAFSLVLTTAGIAGTGKAWKEGSPARNLYGGSYGGLSLTQKGLFPDELKGPRRLGQAANSIALFSAVLSVGTVAGAASSAFNQYGTATWGLGSQQAIRARVLNKYGFGLELIAGAQENTLWNFKGIQPVPDEQILAFGSVGAAVALGGYIPLLQSSWSWNSKPSTTTSAAPAALAASAPTPVSSGNYVEAPTGSSYPFGYAPASATDALLVNASGPLTSLTANPSLLVLHQLQPFAASSLSAGTLNWANDGARTLNDGAYSNIPLIGLSLPGSSGATASFTVSNGSIQPSSSSDAEVSSEISRLRTMSLPTAN
jgi:hypothetical protein